MTWHDEGAVAALDRLAEANLAHLLDELAGFVRRFVVLTPEQVTAAALWITHTHALDAFDFTGYLTVVSPERRSGKTRLLDVAELVVARPWRVVEPSEAVVYRRIEASQPTLLLDEIDAIFGRKRDQTEGLRALLNAGNARGTVVPRCVGPSQALVDFKTFCGKALAGIGTLPDTIADRSVPIEMRRRTRDERCERFRRRLVQPEADAIRERLEHWGEASVDDLRNALERVAGLADDDGALAELDDRAFEQAWEPLLAVASLAGERWLRRAIRAALTLSGGRDADPETIRLRLLADVRSVFERSGLDRLASQTLAVELASDADAPWADWFGKPVTPRAIADLLRPFGVRPRTIRLDDGSTPKGYQREAFEDAWKRYAPVRGASAPPHPPQPAWLSEKQADYVPPQDGFVADRRWGANPHGYSDVADVAAESAGGGDLATRGQGIEGTTARFWLARDGRWRSFADEPPAFPGEVVDTSSTDGQGVTF